MSKFAPHRKSANSPRATSSTICQKCLGTGHFTYQCSKTRPYVSRPSRTQQLENPRALAKLKAEGKPSVEVPEEFKTKRGVANKILEAKEKERAKEQEKGEPSKKRAKRSGSPSSSSDSDSDSGSESDGSSGSSSDSDSRSASSRSSSRSRDRDMRRRVPSRRSPSSGSDRGRQRNRSLSADSREK